MQLCNFTVVLYGSQDWAMSYVVWQLVCNRGKKFFSSPKCSDWPWDHPDSCSLGTRGPFGGGGKNGLCMKLTAHVHLVPKLRMFVAIHLSCYMCS